MLKIIKTDSENIDFLKLIKLLDKDLNSRYGKNQIKFDPFNKIEKTNTAIIAYIKNVPVGIGCFKEYNKNTIEIKRMFVRKEYRGKGISKLILIELEKWARESGYDYAILETGINQPEAIGLYKKNGYNRIENYDQYAGLSESVCFKKVFL